VEFYPLLAFHSFPYGHRAVIGRDRLGGWYDLVCLGGCWAEAESVGFSLLYGAVGFWLLNGSTRKGTGLSTPVAVFLGRWPWLTGTGKYCGVYCGHWFCGPLFSRGITVTGPIMYGLST
jgi:hypothetical protein